MIHTRLLLLLSALLLAGCDFGDGYGGSSDRFKEDFHKSYPLKAGGHVSVENVNGSVEITAWDREEVEVNATRYARTQEILDQVKVDVATAADSVRIRTIRPSEGPNWRGGYGVRYTIRVPRRTELDRVESSNGHVYAEGVDGNVRMKTTNGGVRATAIHGQVTAGTTNGGMDLRDVDGDADLHTTNGGIRADGHKGSVSAETTNGGIRLALTAVTPRKAVHAETTNGNVEVSLPAEAGELHAESTNGGITVRMPAGAHATLRARTSNARVSSDFDVASTFATEKKNRLEGTINGGGPLLELITTNGGIRIQRQ